MNLDIELITGDINQLDKLDFLLIGHKNPLYEQICRETNFSFKEVYCKSWMFPHQYKLLEVPFYKWKQVAAIKFRANGKISETQFVRISCPIETAVKQPQIESIGILPPTWRNPEYCALGVIYSLWIIGYGAAFYLQSSYSNEMREFFPDPTNKKFKIISQTGTEYFEAVLENNGDLMWKFIKKLCKQRKNDPWLYYPYRKFKEIPVSFNVSKKLI